MAIGRDGGEGGDAVTDVEDIDLHHDIGRMDVGLGGNPHQPLRKRDQRGDFMDLGRRDYGEIDMKLGDPLNGYKAEGKVGTFTEAAEWLCDHAIRHYPSSQFAEQFAAR